MHRSNLGKVERREIDEFLNEGLNFYLFFDDEE